MIARKMAPNEIDVTINLCRYYYQEAVEAKPDLADTWDDNSLIDGIRQFNIDYNYTWINLYDGQRPVGFIAGYVTKHIYTTKLQTHIQYIYIMPSHRSMDNFRSLMKAFEEWTRAVGAEAITAGDIGVDPERTEQIYQYLGFERELMMIKELE